MAIRYIIAGKNLSEKWCSPYSPIKEYKKQYWDTFPKMTMISFQIQCKPFNMTIARVYAPTTGAEDRFCETLKHLELTPKNYVVIIIIVDWNAKVGSQKIAGVTGKFGLGIQNEAEHRLV